MNKEETLALWAQGKDAWNAWALTMDDQLTQLEGKKTGALARLGVSSADEDTQKWLADAEANFAGHIFDNAVDFRDWLFPGSANFNKTTFNQGADFSNVRFGGSAVFDEANFSGDTRFGNAILSGYASFIRVIFSGETWFGNAIFSGYARFRDAKFCGDASFMSARFDDDTRFDCAAFSSDASFADAIFHGIAYFDSATFSDDAGFEQTTFKGYTAFVSTTFKKKASFAAAQAESGFSLAGTSFNEVPDFNQAHFKEAPRLDDVRVNPGKAGPDRAARYRALKRLAVQGHDHAREQEYFAGELKSLLGLPDRLLPISLNWRRKEKDGRRESAGRPSRLRYLFGLGYQCFSDFGRSMVRPLVWWGLAVGGFAAAYIAQHFVRAAETGRGYFAGFWAWLWGSIAQPLMDRFPGLAGSLPTPAAVPSPTCLVGDGSPFSAAIGLSIRKALPFAGVGSSEKLNQIYACLYGVHGAALKGSPVIPDIVDCLGIVQLLFSLLLLFLFLLAVRNHFRIK